MKLKRRLLTVLFALVLSCIAAVSAAGCSKNDAASVTFMVDNSVYGIVKVRGGDESLPEEPKKDFYEFDGWYEDRELTEEFDFAEYCASKEREDKTVYAGFTFNGNTYSVVLNGNGGTFGTDTTITVSVREHETVNYASSPVRENYVLTGWSENKKGTKPWNLSTDKITANNVLYAVWARVYTVTFNAGNGTFGQSNSNTLEVTTVEGYDLTVPADPIRNNYVFAGWAIQPNAAEPDWDPDIDTVNADITLYAVWQEKVEEHNVEFVLNYTGAKNEIKSTVRGLIAYEPERAGYIFNGWWNSEGEKDLDGNYILTTKFDLSTRITNDEVKVYAKWINEDDICSVLPAPRITISGSTIFWTDCEGAKQYDIVIWRADLTEDDATVNTHINDTTYTLPSYYEQNIYKVKVRACGDGYTTVNSGWSSSVTFAHKALTTPAVSFDLTTSTVSWSKVRNATEYELYIDGVLTELAENAFEYDLSEYDAGSYQIEINVSASGYASATASTWAYKLRLKAPQVTALYNKTKKVYELNWNKVEKADGYIVTINGYKYNANATSFTIAAGSWEDKDELTYRVDAFNSNANYLISDAKTVKLGTPTTITVEKEGSSGSISVKNGMAAFCYVNFDSKGGSNVTSQTVTGSTGLKYPALPKREGYVFTGWYEDYACTKLFDFTKEIRSDTTVYAGWFKMPDEANHLNNYANLAYSENIPGAGIGVSNLNTSGTSSQKRDFIYYCALNSGNFDITYAIENGGARYGTHFYAYNLTKDEVILPDTLVTTAAKYPVDYEKVSFTAKAGDIIYVSAYRDNTSYSTNYSVHFAGGKAPAAGGKFPTNYLSAGNSFGMGGDSFTAGFGTTVELTVSESSKDSFLGWYTEDGKLISEESTIYYTVEGEATLTAKWE